MQRRCFDCGADLVRGVTDHAYPYDSHEEPVQLRAIGRWTCACGYYETEIPRMGPLHETIAAALRVPGVKRSQLAFSFTEGDRGVENGIWHTIVEGRT